MAVAVVIPGQFRRVQPAHHVYVRRRILVLGVIAIALVLFFGAGRVVANRGGAPASTSTVRPAAQVYVVQPGDTLWSIAERFHGRAALADYVDQLVDRNGGTHLDVAQPLALP